MAHKKRRSSHEERIQAITLIEQGYEKSEVARILQVAESSVYAWQAAYKRGGLAALSTKVASGRKSLLDDKQMLKLSSPLRINPRQLEFDFGLWTRKRVRELIKREFGIDYTEQNVGRILKMLGFSPQRPPYRALQHDEERRETWMNETFPALKKRADQEGASIFFADEAGCRNDHHAGTTWAPVGETPVVDYTGKRELRGVHGDLNISLPACRRLFLTDGAHRFGRAVGQAGSMPGLLVAWLARSVMIRRVPPPPAPGPLEGAVRRMRGSIRRSSCSRLASRGGGVGVLPGGPALTVACRACTAPLRCRAWSGVGRHDRCRRKCAEDPHEVAFSAPTYGIVRCQLWQPFVGRQRRSSLLRCGRSTLTASSSAAKTGTYRTMPMCIQSAGRSDS